ncbi:MAG: hypothetical protein MZV70_40000 [Desulfobacterales bacterium]|nr:hypothetical protein [Desulfobacterales bacterium]
MPKPSPRRHVGLISLSISCSSCRSSFPFLYLQIDARETNSELEAAAPWASRSRSSGPPPTARP